MYRDKKKLTVFFSPIISYSVLIKQYSMKTLIIQYPKRTFLHIIGPLYNFFLSKGKKDLGSEIFIKVYNQVYNQISHVTISIISLKQCLK